jgi:hypothetical protein
VAVIVILRALAVSIRRTPTIGRGEMPGSPAPENNAPSPAASGISIDSQRTTTRNLRLGGRATVKSVVVRRVNVTGQPSKESFTVNGVEYTSVEDIEDPKVRDQIRSMVRGVPDQIDDPKIRQQFEEELEHLGIEDGPASPGSASSG